MVLCLSGAYVMAATILRFRFKTYSLFWLINLVTTGLSVAANYHTLAPYWKFPVHWLYYTLICCSTNLLVAMLVLPQTAGGGSAFCVCACVCAEARGRGGSLLPNDYQPQLPLAQQATSYEAPWRAG